MISISSIIISGVFVFQFLGLHFHGGYTKKKNSLISITSGGYTE